MLGVQRDQDTVIHRGEYYKRKSYRDLAPDIWKGSLLCLELNTDQWYAYKESTYGQGEKHPEEGGKSLKYSQAWDLFALQFIFPPVRIGKFCNSW